MWAEAWEGWAADCPVATREGGMLAGSEGGILPGVLPGKRPGVWERREASAA